MGKLTAFISIAFIASLFMLTNVYACEGEDCYGYHRSNNIESECIIDAIVMLLNDGYIDICENGQLFVVNPLLHGELASYLDRVVIVRFPNYNEICCDYHVDSDYICIDPLAPSGSCTNIFGHQWGNFGQWRSHQPTSHHSTQCGNAAVCVAFVERIRWCSRTHCTRYYRETETIWVRC